MAHRPASRYAGSWEKEGRAMYAEIVQNVTIGLLMIVATFVFHAYSLDRLFRAVEPLIKLRRATNRPRPRSRTWILLATGLGIMTILSAEIWAWAFLYLWLDLPAVHELETALYFSMVSFTTVGYGDIVLSPHDRLLGAMQAASGMLLFGWSTAFMFEILSITYRHDRLRNHANN
jgi:hypothetical protein